MDDRDGQHMGVVTKALVKEVPPSSMIRRVLFMTCKEPVGMRHISSIFDTKVSVMCREPRLNVNATLYVIMQLHRNNYVAKQKILCIVVWCQVHQVQSSQKAFV